jgi:hypothetical protein
MSWLLRYRTHLILFGVGFVVFGGTAYDRMKRQSTDPHFALQADAWLNGRLSIEGAKKKGDDWCTVETVTLDDGSRVRGRRMNSKRVFRTTTGDEIPLTRVQKGAKELTLYVSFPPLPAVLMLPQAAIHGHYANDVWLTVIVAALVLPLFFSLLGRLREAGLSERSVSDDLWLVAALAFGTVFYFSAVQGRVWFTAHVVGVAMALSYVWCCVEARHPILAGLCLGLAAMTRTPMAFMFPLFLFEAYRMGGGRENLRGVAKTCAKFAAPVVVIAILGMIHNYARFDDPLEFGHRYLAVMQQQQLESHGMFDYAYLSRNLTVAFSLLPELSWSKPYVIVSGHGLAMWFTTPLLFFVLWPRTKGPLHRPLWVCVAIVALPTMLYQNSGWLQFGYRFSLDYMVLLFVLIAVGGRQLGRIGKALIIAGIIVNLFGAVTFARKWEHYRADRKHTYQHVVDHMPRGK